jgi:Zn-dependent protease with chaperone function
LENLAEPACRSLYGARQVAIAAHEDTSWFNGLPFILVDNIDGVTDQAQYQRNFIFPWETGAPRLVLVAKGMFAKSSSNELIWTLGHELGHGVYDHSRKRNWLLPVSFVIILGGAVLAWRHNAGRIQRVIGTLFIIAGFVFYPVSIASFSKSHEMDADIFGVKTAARAGIGNKEAQAAALNFMNGHKMNEDSWWKCGLPNRNVHPSTKERADRIRALQRFD